MNTNPFGLCCRFPLALVSLMLAVAIASTQRVEARSRRNPPGADLQIAVHTDRRVALGAWPLRHYITVTNAGPESVSGARLSGSFSNLLDATWFCTPGPGSRCAAVNGRGNVNTTVSLPPGATVDIEVIGFVVWGKPQEVVALVSVSPPQGLRDPNDQNDSLRLVTAVRQPPERLVMPTEEHGEARAAIRDSDGDGVFDNKDNCAWVANPEQLDTDADGIGDPCEAGVPVSPPDVRIIGPSDGAEFPPRSDIPFAVAASDPNGTVVGVRYWFNPKRLAGQVDRPPYAMVWRDALPGTYALTAEAFDNDGWSTVSAPVSFTVHGVDLAAVLSDGGGTARGGESFTYVLIVSNRGPDSATNASVRSAIPLVDLSWSCSSSGGSHSPDVGSSDMAVAVTLQPGGRITCNLTGTVPSTETGALSASASIVAPADVVEVATEDNTSSLETRLVRGTATSNPDSP